MYDNDSITHVVSSLLLDEWGTASAMISSVPEEIKEEDQDDECGRGVVSTWRYVELSGPYVPEMLLDVEAIASDLHNRIMLSSGCRKFKYVAISLCCGSASIETQVLRILQETHGVDVLTEIFHDKMVQSSTLRNIQAYVNHTETRNTRRSMPKVVVSFDDLSEEICRMHHALAGSDTKLLVFGIHARMSAVREVCMFSRLCDRLCKEELIHPGPFLNYLHNENRYVHAYTLPQYHKVPGASSGLRVFSGPWSAMTEWET